MSFINVEIKARCENTQAIEQVLKEHQAKYIGEDHQVDTYFGVREGRLKLRSGNIENALIYYRRPDQTGPKKSDISLYQAQDLTQLLGVLQEALPVKVVVDKRRRIYFIDNVKFHIDQVEGLGSFVEIEAIDYEDNLGETKLQKQVDHYLQVLDIQPGDLLEYSYSDLLSR
jgi:predicted adenylyl cyclase CyaB